MALRKIIRIDEEKCDGCGDCAKACHEGAIAMIDGKARLISETYCDGLGACIGECPQGAITIEEREASEFDEAAVAKHLALQKIQRTAPAHAFAPHAGGGCPGSAVRQFVPPPATATSTAPRTGPVASQLRQWPVQLMLVPPHAPYLKDADLLLCADCVPFAVSDFHARFLSGRALLVGCPKLDDLRFYLQKLQQVFAVSTPRRIMVVKMEVPCCNGIAQVAIAARNAVCPQVPVEIVTVALQGQIIDQSVLPGGHIEEAV